MNNSEEINIEQLPSQIITQQLHNKFLEDELGDTPKLNYLLELYEKSLIVSTLQNYSSIRQAALALGIHDSTLSRKVKKYNIDYNEPV